MGTIADKLLYLDGTKTALRDAINQAGGALTVSTPFRQYAQWITEQSATLSLDFVKQSYIAKTSALVPDRIGFSNIITFTRASGGGRFNASGVYEWLGNDVPRLDYDPVTLQPRGILIEEQRTNLLTYSSDLTNAAWAKNAASVAGDSITSPDGLVTADKLVEDTASGGHNTQRTVTVTSGTTYTFGCFVKAGERTFCELLMAQSTTPFTNHALVRFNLATGAVSTVPVAGAGYGIKPAGNGWYFVWVSGTATSTAEICRISLSQSGTSSYTGDGTSGIYIWGAQLEAGAFPTSYIPTPATFTSRASTATYFNSSGVLTSAAVNEARYDHRFIGGQWVPTGLLLEAAATNYLTNSGVPNGLADTSEAGLVSAVSTGWGNGLPSNGLAFGHDGATLSYAYIQNFNATDNTQYTFSVFVKMSDGLPPSFGSNSHSSTLNDFILVADGDAVLNPQTYTVQAVGGDVYRVSASYTTGVKANVTGNGVLKYATNSSRTFVVSGYQLELGAVATSYIPTTTSQGTRAADVSTSSQVTRSADVASVNTLSPWYNASEGTLYFEGASFGLGTGSASYAVALTDNSINEVITIRRNATGFGGAVVDNGAAQAAFAPTYSAGAITKIAFAFKANDFAMSKDGAAALTDTSGSIPTVDRLNIGATAILSAHLNGHIRNISYYPRRLSNDELQILTTP